MRGKPHSSVRQALKRELWEQDPRCIFCLHEFPLDEMTLDHLKPLAKGGTWDQRNLVLACFECNQLKGTRRWRYGQRAQHRRYLKPTQKGERSDAG